MANQVGTATGLEDLFGKIVTFLTTDAALVAAGQEWDVMRLRRDNLLNHTSNLAEPSTGGKSRFMRHTFRYDPRSLNTDNPETAGWDGHFYANNFSAGVSYNSWQLRQAREVTSVKLRAPVGNGYVDKVPKSFRLQYSDDGTSWTTGLTVTNAPTLTMGERRVFPVGASLGSHVYWRIVWDAVQINTGTVIAWTELLLLEADGTVANHFGSEVILKAPGNAGTDNIYTGIRSEYDAAAGWYNLFMNGYTGFDPNVMSWFRHPGALPGWSAQYPRSVPMVPCWDAAMPYWFSASGRSFRFAVKVSTSYEGGYLGFLLPYATPGQYPYPLAVGGSLIPNSIRSADWRYSYVSYHHGVYPAPAGETASNTSEQGSASLYVRDPSGEWMQFANRPSQNNTSNPESIMAFSSAMTLPFGVNAGLRGVWPHCESLRASEGRRPYRDCLGGGSILQPCVVLQRVPSNMVYGELEGTFSISGYENSAENTTTLNGKTHVIFQNTYRNTVHEYWALSLD